MTDQNGTVHRYEYDRLGRLTADVVETLGTGVDGTVRRIERTYEVRGMVTKIGSCYSAESTGGQDVANQLQFEYNSLGLLTKTYQEHGGPVGVNTLSVSTDYDMTSVAGLFTKGPRATKLTYPNGRCVHYSYSRTLEDPINRLCYICDDNGGYVDSSPADIGSNFSYIACCDIVEAPGIDYYLMRWN